MEALAIVNELIKKERIILTAAFLWLTLQLVLNSLNVLNVYGRLNNEHIYVQLAATSICFIIAFIIMIIYGVYLIKYIKFRKVVKKNKDEGTILLASMQYLAAASRLMKHIFRHSYILIFFNFLYIYLIIQANC